MSEREDILRRLEEVPRTWHSEQEIYELVRDAADYVRSRPDSGVPPHSSGPSEEMARVGVALATQDNRATANPIFAVQQRVRDWGFDGDGYSDAYVWVNDDDHEDGADEAKAAELDRLDDEMEDTGSWRKVYYRDRWEFVQPFLTEAGAEAYIALNGHNLTDPRIYVYSGYRNAEWKALRDWLNPPAGLCAVGGATNRAEKRTTPEAGTTDRPSALCVDADLGSYRNQVAMYPPERLGLRGPIGVDLCLASEIAGLWARGIRTVESCCGHGKQSGYIMVRSEDREAMESLGYEVFAGGHRPGFFPKTGCVPAYGERVRAVGGGEG